MTELQWGIPIQGGEMAPGGLPVFLYKVGADGTRKIEPHVVTAGGYWTTGVLVPTGGPTMPVEYAGYIPTMNRYTPDEPGYYHYDRQLTPEEGEFGVYVHYASSVGSCRLSYGERDVPTPGTDYYKIRKITGEHALRYMDENPIAAMRLSDPNQHRIHTVGYELTDEEWTKAGNNDYQIRGTIGLLHMMNEGLRIMPYGTPELDALWHALRDKIYALLVPFCALCDGAGMSYRTIRKHPHVHWERYQKAGLRISSDRDFNTTSLWHYGMLNPEAHRIDLENFERAADFASEGYPDDDFNLPPFRGRVRVIPSIPTPQMPDFGGDLTRDYLVAGYRTVYDRFKATPPTGFDEGIVRKWITLQLLAILDERNFDNAGAGRCDRDQLRIHQAPARRLVPQLQHLARARERLLHPVPDILLVQSNPAFGALRQREDVYMTDAPDTPENSADIVVG